MKVIRSFDENDKDGKKEKWKCEKWDCILLSILNNSYRKHHVWQWAIFMKTLVINYRNTTLHSRLAQYSIRNCCVSLEITNNHSVALTVIFVIPEKK